MNNNKGFLNPDGSVLMSLNFPEDEGEMFGAKYVLARDDFNKTQRLLDMDGNEIIRTDSTQAIFYYNERFALIKTWAQIPNKASGKETVFDLEQKKITGIDYLGQNIYRENGKCGLFNQYGDILPIYDSIYGFSGKADNPSLYLVIKDGKKGLVDKKGNLVLDFKYDEINPVIPDVPLWEYKNISDVNFKSYFLMMPHAYNNFMLGSLENDYTDLCFVVYNGKRGYVNLKNEKVWEEK